ncbi:putative secreted protein (Por secretion system target) [Marinoscillum furvescens DSM 4134]|uniref:Putative secreted protein (Por secretion system target) n=2 Tax=Marinoscillum furvescens TaxID=1026 RepID=A0A3D9KW05_MARFU|nr:putative secreted protein (Por secretion system target) [Marinoscillum furvescens DSM 4134]
MNRFLPDVRSIWTVCCLLIGMLTTAQTVVDRHGALSVQGAKIVDECGRDAQLKGPSFFHHTWEGTEFWNANAVGWLASDWKAEVVRAAMAADPHVTGSYPDDPTGSLNKVRAVVDGAIQHGIYVIIDFHAHAMQQSTAEQFFSTMAQEYGSYPNVIYEIYNEPTGSSWTNLDQTWADLKNYSRNLIATIRQYDPDNLIIVPTPFYDQFVHQAADDPLTTDINGNPVGNIAYTLHIYADAHRFDGQHGDWAKYALSKGLPMFVTESGATGTQYNEPRSTGINAPNYTEWNKWENWWDANGIGFCKWSLSTKDEFGSSLLPGAPANGNWNYNTDLTDEGRWNRDHFRAVNTLPSACSSSSDDIISISVPNSVTPGSNATVTVDYSASTNRDIQVIFQLDHSPYTNYGSKKVDVSSGSGTLNVSVPINSSTPIANDDYQFQVFITTDGGNWSSRLDNMSQNNIDAVSGGSANVQVRARMTNGTSDNLQLRVDNSTVKTWTISGSSYATYSYSGAVSGNVKLYFPDNGTDMEVDWLKVDGTTYQAENQSTNTAVWQGGSCGGSNSQLMHCAGHIDFGTIGGSSYSATKYEAENATLSGTYVSTSQSGYTGSGFVDGLDNNGDKMTWTVNVPAADTYPLTIRYSLCNNQQNYVVINGNSTSHSFTDGNGGCGGWEDKVINVSLNSGNNTIAIEKNWGWMPVDYIIVGVPSGSRQTSASVLKPEDLKIFPNPIDEQGLNLQLPNADQPFTVRIHDLMGAEVFSAEGVNSSSLHIGRDTFGAQGIYMLKLYVGDQKYTRKLLVK